MSNVVVSWIPSNNSVNRDPRIDNCPFSVLVCYFFILSAFSNLLNQRTISAKARLYCHSRNRLASARVIMARSPQVLPIGDLHVEALAVPFGDSLPRGHSLPGAGAGRQSPDHRGPRALSRRSH